ncbi:MAG: TonB-dependent receptor [Bacteroidota bacterium]
MIPLIRFFFLWSAFLIMGTVASAQSLTGVLRGNIQDRQTEEGLSTAEVVLTIGPETAQTTTDAAGNFRLEGLLVGRYEVQVRLEGYRTYVIEAVVSSGKEQVLQIPLEKQVFDMDEVVMVPDRPRGTPRNGMAMVSALSFEVEETRKFAGGLDDPTRVAANFPGVVATPFISENFISVRGNSARGLLYRLEGVDIPNPNHFARIGSSGGSFTIFSNQILANSDFFVGAFPAEYGNATSGVFDVHFRNGNNEQHEFALQAGVLGVDLAAEGPLTKNKGASYLVNYRYSSLGLVNNLISYLTLPTYQDFSFKLHLPTEKAGTFNVFGIGGISERLRDAELDSSLWEVDLDRFQNDLSSDMAAVGINHTYLLGNNTVWKSTLVGSYSFLRDNKEYVEDDLNLRQRDVNEYRRLPLTFTTSVTHRFSPRHTHKSGIILNTTQHDYAAQDFDYVEGKEFTRASEAGNTRMVQAYTQSQFHLGTRFKANLGLHALYFDLNQRSSIEPRAGISYRLDPRSQLAVGYGLHSRVEHWGIYQTRLNEANGEFSLPNQNLDFIKSHHFVLSYQTMLSDHLRLRTEAYYQSLFNVPVEIGGTWSTVNLSELDELRVLANDGTGRNVGLDIGLERFSRAGLYYMLNASVFNSSYTDATGMRHSTAFNTGYKANLLMGKEKKVGRKKGYNSLFGWNGALSILGGQRLTAIDPVASQLARETIFDETDPWSIQESPLFILDATLTYRRNHEKFTGIWVLQIKNLFSTSVPEFREWDPFLQEEVRQRGASVLPVLSYKVVF